MFTTDPSKAVSTITVYAVYSGGALLRIERTTEDGNTDCASPFTAQDTPVPYFFAKKRDFLLTNGQQGFTIAP